MCVADSLRLVLHQPYCAKMTPAEFANDKVSIVQLIPNLNRVIAARAVLVGAFLLVKIDCRGIALERAGSGNSLDRKRGGGGRHCRGEKEKKRDKASRRAKMGVFGTRLAATEQDDTSD